MHKMSYIFDMYILYLLFLSAIKIWISRPFYNDKQEYYNTRVCVK